MGWLAVRSTEVALLLSLLLSLGAQGNRALPSIDMFHVRVCTEYSSSYGAFAHSCMDDSYEQRHSLIIPHF